MKTTIPKTDLRMVRETESIERYILLYEKSFEVMSIAELFNFL